VSYLPLTVIVLSLSLESAQACDFRNKANFDRKTHGTTSVKTAYVLHRSTPVLYSAANSGSTLGELSYSIQPSE
jgi:hypothetical protein